MNAFLQQAAIAALKQAIASGSTTFAEELLVTLGDVQLEAIKRLCDKILAERNKTVSSK